MGQYYSPCILNTAGKPIRSMYAHYYNSGVKLMEHSWLDNDFVAAFEVLLAIDGAQRVVWAGDYADAEPGLILPDGDDDTFEGNLHNWAEELKVEFNVATPAYGTATYLPDPTPKPHMVAPFLVTTESHPFIINVDRHQFVDKRKVEDESGMFGEAGWKIHPLPLLTVEGNGRGGGDFRGPDTDNIKVGMWSRDRISVGDAIPVDYEEILFDLHEDR